MTSKIAMFSNGTAIVHEGGNVRKASAEEVKSYLVSIVPSMKKGAALKAVKFEDGFVYARYDNNKVFRKKIAQQTDPTQTEPVNSIDKAKPAVKVPRDKAKAKPQIDVGRPDVNSPTEVRKDNYDKGKGAEDLHKGIPRSKSNSGLAGSKKTDFAEETANKATSGKPDSYVQKFEDSETPAKAGSEKNHAASSAVTVKSESEIYSKVIVAKEDPKEEKTDEKDAKSNLPPWLQKGKKDTKEDKSDDKKDEKDSEAKKDDEKVATLERALKKAQSEAAEFKAELNKFRSREARQKSAVKLTLAYRDLSPEKYASADSFSDKVDEIVKKMNVEAIETALEELKTFHREAFQKQTMTKEAALADGRVATAFSTPMDSPTQVTDYESLKAVLMANTSLGKKVAEYESYTPHVKE